MCLVLGSDSLEAANSKNVLGSQLQVCGLEPKTGFFRNGLCETGPSDSGVHVVCAQMTDEFLRFTLSQGNDLISARGSSFPGLKDGDRWCLCALRWREADEAGLAPPVILESTNQAALKYVELEKLKKKAI